MIIPDSYGADDIAERGWTDAARAAAIAARRAKAKLTPVVSGSAARAEAQGAAKRLMDERRRVMAQQKAASASSHPLDQRLAKLHADKLAAIDRVGAKLAPKVKNPRKEAIKSAGRAAGRFLKRLFFKEAEGDYEVLDFVVNLREAGTLLEKWSEAARAAASAARRAKGRGQDWKKAGRKAYVNRLSPAERVRATTASAGDKKVAARKAERYASRPGSRIAQGMRHEFERERGERKANRFVARPKKAQALADLWAN